MTGFTPKFFLFNSLQYFSETGPIGSLKLIKYIKIRGLGINQLQNYKIKTVGIYPRKFITGALSWYMSQHKLQFYKYSFHSRVRKKILWFILELVLFGLEVAFYKKESGYPWRNFASSPDRAYKLGIQVIACLFQDTSRNLYHAWVREGSNGQFYLNTT